MSLSFGSVLSLVIITGATEVHLHRNIRFVRFCASGRARKQLPVLRQMVFQEEIFFTLGKALVM